MAPGAVARAYIEESLRAYRALDDPFGTGWALHELALIDISIVAWRLGQSDRAWRLGGAADRLRQQSGSDLVLAPRLDLTASKRPSGDAPAEAAWVEGEQLTIEAAIAYALSED